MIENIYNLKPRHVIGIIGMVLIAALMFQGTVDQMVGVAVIMGILTALSAYSVGVRNTR